MKRTLAAVPVEIPQARGNSRVHCKVKHASLRLLRLCALYNVMRTGNMTDITP